MSNEETAVHIPAGAEPAALASKPIADEEAYAPVAPGDWGQEPGELLPRPRRRLLGAGASPIPIALLGVLLLACGFIGGVLVEKGQTSSTAGGAGDAARLAALRGGSAASASTAASTSGGAAGAGAAAGGGFGGRFAGAGAAGGATIGEVSYISGSTLYVSGTEGNTVKITTSAASSITKTVKSSVHGIHPGETVIVRGSKGADGVVSAESISVSAAGAGTGGIGALFGGGAGARGGGTGASGDGTGASAGSGGAAESALFGK
jgi:hypothetical protein